MSHTSIVMLNWNGASDTIECLESVLRLRRAEFRVIVCDNGSSDSSLERISAWARVAGIPFQQVRAGQQIIPPLAKLVLIDNGANLGFAAGNNTGIELALALLETTHVWLLNNDTIIEPNALEEMLRRMAQDQTLGACGSLIKFYDDRSIIQAVGGCSFNFNTGIASQTLGRYLPDTTVIDVSEYEAKMDYISGASMLLSRGYLETIGLMEESYFLYYEEIDWAVRAKGQFRLGIAVNSVVYHKEGSGTGSASFKSAASPVSEFYMIRSKLRFMRKHLRHHLPTVYLTTFAQALNRFRRGEWQAGSAILTALSSRNFVHAKSVVA
ncbi:MAG: GT2 family glycosyltransferase [Candidatus Azotimanducaceae bacterium]|jgi:GT2 family glycosyltransferase